MPVLIKSKPGGSYIKVESEESHAWVKDAAKATKFKTVEHAKAYCTDAWGYDPGVEFVEV